jgi:hypothetical protein
MLIAFPLSDKNLRAVAAADDAMAYAFAAKLIAT